MYRVVELSAVVGTVAAVSDSLDSFTRTIAVVVAERRDKHSVGDGGTIDWCKYLITWS